MPELTTVIESEGDGFVSRCPELEVASQGHTIEDAKKNLKEALELFFECASELEIQQRMAGARS
jgi:predicted RNase H-like HicB family nuclease